MRTTDMVFPAPPVDGVETAMHLALRLAHLENTLHTLAGGQIDAVVDPSGKTYLLHSAQEHLRRSEEGFRTLIDSTADLITVINRGGKIISKNRAAIRVLGCEPASMVDKSFFEFVHIDDLAEVHAAFINVIDGFCEEATVEFRHQTGGGAYRKLEATMSRIRDATVSRVVMVSRAITPLRLAAQGISEREAEVSQSRMRFLAMLSHELRTPLTPALLGIEELLKDERFAEAEPTLTMVLRNIGMQSRLLEELTDFISIGQSKVRLRPESLDAHAAVRSVLEICEAEISAARIEILLDLRASENMVMADAVRFQQVMWNLLKNAIKFSPPGSSISITSANDPAGSLSLSFADHGIGIEPRLLPLLFNAFQQGDRMAYQLSGGLGLGLFIAKGLAEAQDGTLTAASEGRGKGATFCLSLKTVRAAEPPVKPVGPPQYDAQRILLVEDHADTRAVLQRLLERRGHTVFPAGDVASALRVAEICDFNVLISDVGLPDGTGYELMTGLRLARPSLVGIALSGFGTPSDIDQSRAAGFCEHLVKPVSFESLQAAMHTAAVKT